VLRQPISIRRVSPAIGSGHGCWANELRRQHAGQNERRSAPGASGQSLVQDGKRSQPRDNRLEGLPRSRKRREQTYQYESQPGGRDLKLKSKPPSFAPPIMVTLVHYFGTLKRRTHNNPANRSSHPPDIPCARRPRSAIPASSESRARALRSGRGQAR
jgi:hypothetical protein